jgi:hypothetical protein
MTASALIRISMGSPLLFREARVKATSRAYRDGHVPRDLERRSGIRRNRRCHAGARFGRRLGVNGSDVLRIPLCVKMVLAEDCTDRE